MTSTKIKHAFLSEQWKSIKQENENLKVCILRWNNTAVVSRPQIYGAVFVDLGVRKATVIYRFAAVYIPYDLTGDSETEPIDYFIFIIRR